jgi:hypothetical protein
MNENVPFNIGDLAKPATTLIEKVSEGIGGIFAPYQIVRIEKAKSKAAEIKAKSDALVNTIQYDSNIEVNEKMKRAAMRLMAEETRKQDNIESITTKAIEDLKEDAKPENIENDWIANFFDKCKLVSDEEMQKLWGKILAGEANSPGKFSKRTIEFVSTMSKEDAKSFEELSTFRWYVGDKRILVYDYDGSICASNNINFDVLTHLNSIGLIDFEPITGYSTVLKVGELFTSYFNSPIFVTPPVLEGTFDLSIGYVLLTKIGKELLDIIPQVQSSEFYEFVLQKWYKQGITLASLYPRAFVIPDIPYWKKD